MNFVTIRIRFRPEDRLLKPKLLVFHTYKCYASLHAHIAPKNPCFINSKANRSVPSSLRTNPATFRTNPVIIRINQFVFRTDPVKFKTYIVVLMTNQVLYVPTQVIFRTNTFIFRINLIIFRSCLILFYFIYDKYSHIKNKLLQR